MEGSQIQIRITRGDTTSLLFTITAAYDSNGNPLTNLAGCTARLQARYYPNDSQVVFSRLGIVDASNMKVLVNIEPSDTAGLAGGEHLVADLEMIDPAGNVKTVDVGEQPLVLIVDPDVTR